MMLMISLMTANVAVTAAASLRNPGVRPVTPAGATDSAGPRRR